MAEPILRVLHDQSRFAPGSTIILTLVNRPPPGHRRQRGVGRANKLTNVDIVNLAQTNNILRRKRRAEWGGSGRWGAPGEIIAREAGLAAAGIDSASLSRARGLGRTGLCVSCIRSSTMSLTTLILCQIILKYMI
jgi:hypothetical protein